MNKSLSNPNISEQMDHTPPNFVFKRNKRGREHEYDSDLSAFKDEMKALMSAQHDELQKIYPTLMEIKNSNSNIENSVAFLTKQNEELKNKLQQLEVQARKDQDYITILEDKVEDLQRLNRKASIEIKNAPKITKESKEDLIKMVECLAKAITCDFDKSDISDIYRVKSKRDETKSGPIIVEMTSVIKKTEFLKMSKAFNIKHKEKICAKHLGFTINEYTPIFISEQLTAKGARLHFLSRDLAKSKSYKYCWTAYGRVYIRKDENSPIIVVKSESQVTNLMQLK